MKRKRLAVLLVGAVLALCPALAQASVINVPADYSTIQAAVNAAAPGDTVQVAAGVYQESLGGWRDIEIKKSVNIVGAGSGQTVVQLSGLQHGVEIYGTNLNVLIEGITFTRKPGNDWSAGWTIIVGEVASSFSSLVFRDVEVAYASSRLVSLVRAQNPYTSVVFEDCYLHHSGAWGLSARGDIDTMELTNCTVEFCGLVQAAYGIGLDVADMPPSVVDSLTVTGGSFSNNTAKGINLMAIGSALFDGVTASNNAGAPGGGFGVCLWEWSNASSDLTFQNCTVTGNGLDGFLFGAETGCTIDNVSIEDCLLSGNGRSGVFAMNYNGGQITNLSVNDCNIVGNGTGIIALGPGIDAENNWWGDPNGPGPVGPGAGDKVTSGVDYDPWLGKPAGANALWVGATLDNIYVQPGETCWLTLNQSSLAVPVVGFQAFLAFDTSKFSIDASGISFTPAPYGLSVWKVVAGANIDLAAGIDQYNGQTATQADAVLANMGFAVPPGTPDTTTRVLFRAHDPESLFSDDQGNDVPPTLVDGPTIYIDGTPPVNVTISANPASWTKDSPVTLTFSASDAFTGIDHYELSLAGGAFFTATSPYDWDVTGLATGTYDATVKAFDKAGNWATASTTVYIDKTAPTITIDSAKQGGTELIGGPNAIQGVVDIYVTATDANSGLIGVPTVTVTPFGGSAEAATYVDAVGDTYHYTWTVTSSTPNGTATINASAADNVGNVGDAVAKTFNVGDAVAKTFNVNKSQAVVTIQLESVTTNVTRWIRFTIGGTGGSVAPLVVEKQVAFVAGVGTATFTDLSNAGAWTRISAKDEQHTLQQTVDLVNTGDNQFTASFTGADQLPGGDLNNDNLIDIRDFGVFTGQYGTSPALNTKWPTRNADISCDGIVDSPDFSYIQINFLQIGDAAAGNAAPANAEFASALTSISVTEFAKEVGLRAAYRADINRDGVIDLEDVRLFIDKKLNVQR